MYGLPSLGVASSVESELVDSPKDVIFGTHRAILARENPTPGTTNAMPLSLGHVQHPGGVDQDTSEALSARSGPKCWLALSVLSQSRGRRRLLSMTV